MTQKRCFVVMGYGTRLDLTSKKMINLDKVYHKIIKPAVEECGYDCYRGDEVLDSGLIDESMYYGILESDLVVADLTTLNPNAIYELGVRHGVRRYKTVIMMETSDKFFFDLNHNRTITYIYFKKEKAFKEEAKKVRERIKAIIQEIDKHENIDSPLYKFITDLSEPHRGNDKEACKKADKPIFQRIKDAVVLREKAKYTEACSLFESLAKEIPGDPYFKQQLALCTYKSKLPTEEESLEKANDILKPLADSIDPETNGLLASIYKRKFYLSSDISDIDKAIDYCKRAYTLYDNYYNGENYAFCLLLKASKVNDEDDRNELKVIARHTYKEVFNNNKEYNEEEVNSEYEIWMLATLASCSMVLGKDELLNKYESDFLAKANRMMKTSYFEQKKILTELLNK